MKTLYSRIVLTTIGILLLSSFTAFILSNLYYQYNLKGFNDRKITSMAHDIERFYTRYPDVQARDYLEHVGKLGYQIYLVDEHGKGEYYGGEFRNTELAPEIIRQVLGGETYHGIRNFPSGLFITGFFDNDLNNSIGVPIEIGGATHALFLRPDVTVQFGEMRIFFSIILLISILLCILLVGIVTRHIVKPIVKLTEATQHISQGKYDLKLDVKRQDEIGKLADHFSRMAKGLEQLEQMRQEFVSNVSHEIQSPLASIQGFSQTLQSQNLSAEQQQRYLSIIEEESRRMSHLSKQLLMLASLDKEDNLIDKTPFDLADQIRQVLTVTEWSWRSKDLAMDLELPSLYVHGDPQLLHQVWTNLLTNSIKFTEEGGTITIRLSRQNNLCSVEISDTGIGISESDLPHIFNRFYKADTARDRKENSTGLGLSITKKIIDLHHGHIEVKSRPGEGTTFRVRLPAV
ncbi:HAMP domain-containing sensor histidine kinase [Paenibacillus sp. DMB20]|uniref:HAMP domain-containing sensor histidine kinase n=1 Tax=Paenibacillus sp. DMB20 TaxID=1642570 RepID=UPI000628252A|nr:HAMP domain-containing sensor histidine kinase [Paenibacillus sp. DMB20]KKO54389.1 membrane protein [Paenibacillus sp. DMB20]